jgi:glycosyltransferase involved in cell wall biosynthesis
MPPDLHFPARAQSEIAQSQASGAADKSSSRRKIIYDGLNLALTQGTGIATYTRVLAHVTREIGYEVGVVYSSPQTPPKASLAREIAFFDAPKAVKIAPVKAAIDSEIDRIAYWRPVRPKHIEFTGTVVTREFSATLPAQDDVYAARNLFSNARRHFARTNRFVNLAFDRTPDIFHCTYQLPLQVKGACNIFTIHDLIPLRLPFTTLDNKRYMLRLLRKIAAQADHIITVSEHSKRDIVEILGVDAARVTNTYQSVVLPERHLQQTEGQIADRLAGSYGVGIYDYFLFFGALEPKKNIARLIDAYLSSSVDIPLLIVGGEGWQTEAEQQLLRHLRESQQSQIDSKRRVHRINYVSLETLITFIRGARAVIFPSLYEGFGLPVLEAMALGTPVITSTESSVPEVAGDAAVLVDPYDITAISRAINTIFADTDLRQELSRRGKLQAAKFSLDTYRERVQTLYASLA